MAQTDAIIRRNAVAVTGAGDRQYIFAHGFGCDQSMWRRLTEHLPKRGRHVLFDYTGFGASDADDFDPVKYGRLDGYAADLVEVCDAVGAQDAILVGHSVSAMIGLLAAIDRRDLFSGLVMINPSPCFLNMPPDYHGGFERADLEELVALIDGNALGWPDYLAPMVMGRSQPDHLINELGATFRAADPRRARIFAEATFFSDCRALLHRAPCPSLVLQSVSDPLAPPTVAAYLQAELPRSRLEFIETEGHCLHMTNPSDVAEKLGGFEKSLTA